MDSRALFSLQQAVDDIIFPRIIGATSAKEAWNIIQGSFKEVMRVWINKNQKNVSPLKTYILE